MLNRTSAFRLVLLMLLLASLACNTIMGGAGRDDIEDAEATASALQTEAAEDFACAQSSNQSIVVLVHADETREVPRRNQLRESETDAKPT